MFSWISLRSYKTEWRRTFWTSDWGRYTRNNWYIQDMVLADPRLKVREIVVAFGISHGSVFSISNDHLGMSALFVRWVLCLLTITPKEKNKQWILCQVIGSVQRRFEGKNNRILSRWNNYSERRWIGCFLTFLTPVKRRIFLLDECSVISIVLVIFRENSYGIAYFKWLRIKTISVFGQLQIFYIWNVLVLNKDF